MKKATIAIITSLVSVGLLSAQIDSTNTLPIQTQTQADNANPECIECILVAITALAVFSMWEGCRRPQNPSPPPPPPPPAPTNSAARTVVANLLNSQTQMTPRPHSTFTVLNNEESFLLMMMTNTTGSEGEAFQATVSTNESPQLSDVVLPALVTNNEALNLYDISTNGWYDWQNLPYLFYFTIGSGTNVIHEQFSPDLINWQDEYYSVTGWISSTINPDPYLQHAANICYILADQKGPIYTNWTQWTISSNGTTKLTQPMRGTEGFYRLASP